MLKATVTGRIWSTKKLGEVPAGSILEVQVDETRQPKLLAFDPLGCGDGEKSSWRPAPLPLHGFRARRRPSTR